MRCIQSLTKKKNAIFLIMYNMISVSLMQMRLKVSYQKSFEILNKLVSEDSELDIFLSWVFYKKNMTPGTKLWEFRNKQMKYK